MKKYFLILKIVLLTLQCPNEKNCRACQKLDNIYTCTQCENSKIDLSKQKCVDLAKSSKIENCKIYSMTSKCEICDYGFSLERDGTCKKCKIKNCAFCEENNGICEGCFDSMSITQNECSSKIKCELSNCEICHKNQDFCLKCKENFSMTGGSCIQGILGCLILDPHENSRCVLCDFGYYINKNWECELNEKESSKVMIWVLLIIILLIILGYLFYRYYLKPSSLESDEAYRSVED